MTITLSSSRACDFVIFDPEVTAYFKSDFAFWAEMVLGARYSADPYIDTHESEYF